jgi:hypothetical protein
MARANVASAVAPLLVSGNPPAKSLIFVLPHKLARFSVD